MRASWLRMRVEKHESEGYTTRCAADRDARISAPAVHGRLSRVLVVLFCTVLLHAVHAQIVRKPDDVPVPPRVRQAERFLRSRRMRGGRAAETLAAPTGRSQDQTPPPAWEPLGPQAVVSANYGLVTGRVSSLALDPSDTTGNTLYVGTTGGGVWVAENAATTDPGKITFRPLTDHVPALVNTATATISIGAVTVQPGGTGVILAGTGDANDALDSYYGAGLLRSTDGGSTWSLIQTTVLDVNENLAGFLGEGFAGFAWSTTNPQFVVAAVAQAYGGQLVYASQGGLSYTGLYYSADSGATWRLAKVTDPNGTDLQGPTEMLWNEGSSATSVVWNPVRRMFLAAIRFHGYYQSSDGVTWTRLTNQPGSGLTTSLCPTDVATNGSTSCPIWRGSLAVNPLTGDTFAWTVDVNNQDQGLWQDACAPSAGVCTNQTVAFGKQWNTAALETTTSQGSATVNNGDYNLALAAVPAGQDTLLFAGGNDLWKCSLAMGCSWRNTTNATSCMSAQVGEYQHVLEWSADNPLEIFVGNDSGLWRSEDAVGETGSACSASDATHFQNLNGGIGSLAEVESLAPIAATPYTLLAGLGANGTAGVKSTTGPTAQWPEVLTGEGGPVAIDPTNGNTWYVNNGAGVSIYRCSKAGACTPSDFGTSPVVSNANVGGDGLTMTVPAPFVVDPADSSQVLVGTCRVWRGPVNGTAWTSTNAISRILDGNVSKTSCSGNSLIRSIAALALPGGGEVVYAGMYSNLAFGGSLPGHVLTATMSANGTWSSWQDLTNNPVVNSAFVFNRLNLDISSLYVDPHDTTGMTVYVTIAGLSNAERAAPVAYRSIDGGAHWQEIGANLPYAPANSIVVDPVDPETVYAATDLGVYATQAMSTCPTVNCWTALGNGLPQSPVVGLRAVPAVGSPNVLVAATYGRGLWQIPLLTASTQPTSVSANPTSLAFGSLSEGTTSSAQAVILTNTGALAMLPTSVTLTGDFVETDNCANASIDVGASCTLHVMYAPQTIGAETGQIVIAGNFTGGSITISLSGTGTPPNALQLSPSLLAFGNVEAGSSSAPLQVSVENSSAVAVGISSVTVSSPFVLSTNACGTSVGADSACQLAVEFQPATAGAASGTLTLTSTAGVQTVQLSGTGTAPPTDTLSPASLSFPATIIGATSAAQAVTLSNSGGNPLNSITASVSGPFQVADGCTTQIAGGTSCSISVTYVPTAAGTQSGTLTVADALRTQTVSLAGTGVQPPAFSVSPASLTFASQVVGTSSAAQTIALSNSGGAAMSNIGFQVTGVSAGSFAVSATTCGASLTPGASCSAQVIFTPTAAGTATATLTITSSTAGVKPLTVALTGNGQSNAALVANPAQLTFAAETLGQTSAAQTVTITDAGSTTAAGLTVTTAAPFALTQLTCGGSLAAGASCSTGVTFTPMQNGALTGSLTITSSSVGTATTVALSGTGGVTGAVQLQPARIDFPMTSVGTTSSPVTVTITNGSSSVVLGSLSSSVSSGFQMASTTCSNSLAPGASCTAAIAFVPTQAGAASGSLTITSSALSANATVPLTGTGFDFAVSGAGALTQTVSSGQTATYTLNLAAAVPATATYTFACGTLPADATCVFNPASNSVAAGATGTETIQITTSQTSGELRWPLWRRGAAGIALAGGLLLVPLVRRRRRWLWLAALAIPLSMLVSCAGSGGGGGSSGGGSGGGSTNDTPAGTYSIPVTVSSSGVQHNVTLTLVVD